MITEQEFLEKLREATKADGSIGKFAARTGLSPTYVSDILRGVRPPSDSVAQALGYEKAPFYIPQFAEEAQPEPEAPTIEAPDDPAPKKEKKSWLNALAPRKSRT